MVEEAEINATACAITNRYNKRTKFCKASIDQLLLPHVLRLILFRSKAWLAELPIFMASGSNAVDLVAATAQESQNVASLSKGKDEINAWIHAYMLEVACPVVCV